MTSLWNRRRTDAVALLTCFFATGFAAGQPSDQPNVYLSVSVDAKQKMQLLEGFLAQKNWGEAVELLQTLAERQGDRLAPTTNENPSLFINVRTYCNARLAALPPEALSAYRARVDGQADALWRQWEQSRDERALAKIADEFFCSTVAPKAVDRLGDQSFGKGMLSDAVGWWTKLLPRDWSVGRIDEYPELQFRLPPSSLDVARVAAKCIVAKAVGGDLLEAKRLLAVLRVKYPNAKGRFAGAEGLYVEILAKLIDSKQLAAPKASEDFLTFAGDERRNKASATKADVGGLQFLWDFDVEANAGDRDESPSNDPRLPHFPAVVGDSVYAASESAVWKFDLKTGKAARWLDFAGTKTGSDISRAKYTVTIKGTKLFVTVYDQRGAVMDRPRRFGPRRDWHNVNSTLICFDLTTQKEIWRALPSDFGADRGAVFEGSPIAVGDDVCIAVTRYDAMSETSILRIDVAGRRVVWKAVVCESMAESGVADPPMYNLLSLGDSTIYYCTNLGAVAAVRAEDGKLQWAATYTRRSPVTTAPGDPSIPDLNPCVVYQGRVFALPRDGRRLICYDAQTGEKQWESPASLAFAHILGAQDGVVVATGSRVCAFDVASGKLRWMRPTNSTPGFGRGMIAGGDVYWPTRTDIHVYDLKTGDLARPPIELFTRLGHRPGNLLHAGDYLLIAQSHRLLAFCSFNKLIERHRREITANPESPEPRFKLGEAFMQRGDFAEAAEAFAAAGERSGKLRMVEGKSLSEAANSRRFEALMALAEKSPASSSKSAFQDAFQAARSPDQQASALSREFPKADSKRQVDICQTILSSAPLRAASITRDETAETAGKWAVRNLQVLLSQHGRTIYAEHEAEFSRRLAEARNDPTALLELSERFPLASTLAKSLEARADAAFRTGDFAAAEKLCKQWSTSAEAIGDHGSIERSIALLIQCQRSLGRTEAAYLWAASLSRSRKGDWPTKPAIRRWDFDLQPGLDPTSAALCSSGVHDVSSRFDVEMHRRGDKSEIQWSSKSGSKHSVHTSPIVGTVTWVGRTPDGITVAMGDELLFFTSKDPQKPAWRKRIREPQRFRTLPSPTTRPSNSILSASRFLIAGDLVVAATDHGLSGVETTNGAERWRADLPVGSDRPPTLSLVDASLLVESDSGTTVYDPMTGRVQLSTTSRFASAAASNHLLAVAERSSIQGFDQRTGASVWKKQLSNPTVRDPILVGNEESLFVVEDGSQLVALEPKRGTVKWRNPLASAPASDVSAAVDSGSVCVLAGGTLECWDSKSGERRWRKRLDGGMIADSTALFVTIADDQVIVSTRGAGQEQRFALKTGDASAR